MHDRVTADVCCRVTKAGVGARRQTADEHERDEDGNKCGRKWPYSAATADAYSLLTAERFVAMSAALVNLSANSYLLTQILEMRSSLPSMPGAAA